MNTIIRKKSLAFVVNQGVAVFTAGAFLFTSLGASAAEATFWEERAAASARLLKRGQAEPTLLAQLSLAQPPVFKETGRVFRPVAPSLSNLSASSTPSWARAVVSPFADVRSIYEGQSGDLRVLLVMDAHGIYSAQKNVARLLDQVGAQGKMLVGVEGTTGAFDLERHRNLLPGAGQAQLVDHLLKKGFLNGPEYYGLTAEKMPDFWGVEDAALYGANVQAYRDTLAIESETLSALQTLKKETVQQQTRLYSTNLQNLDREVQSRHEDRGDLAKYVKVVLEEAGESRQGSQVRRFMEAKSKEDRLSFSEVEQARAAFIEKVSPRLSPFELNSLVRDTTAFRAGSKSAKDYYQDLVSLALSKGVPVSAYPAFQSYIEYVSLTDGIDVVALMDEMEALEERAYARLAVGVCAPLVEWAKDLRLAERALQRAMTPREWALFERRRGDLSRLAERAVTLGISREPAELLQSHLPRFAAFFEAATARNNTLLDNALTQARQREATTVVLVTGGFHGPALEKQLAEKNISHVVLTPRIDAVPDSAAGYLGAFAPTRTPLEKLLLGDRLFMNPPSATGAAVADPGHSFHPAAVALKNAVLVYGSVVAAANGKLASFVDLWNERFGNLGRAVVQRVKGIFEIRFSDNRRTALLLALDGAGATITSQGGEVVEEGQIGDVRFTLGGKNITSIVPELIATVGFVVLYWGSALSPPIYIVGLLAGIVLGGILVRGIILGSLHLHEIGHALFLQRLGGPSVQESYAQYSENISLNQIIPFSDIFIPLLSPADKAPRMSVGKLTEGWKTRVTALVGPAVNLLAVVILAQLGLLVDAGSVLHLLLTFAGGANFWMAITSISDFKMAVLGIGDALYCGNLGMLGKRRPTDRGILPKNADAILARMWKQIIVRGGQSGGRSNLGSKGFVRARLLNPKRAKLDQALRTSFRGEIGRRRATGSRPLDNFIEEHDHARFATGGPSKKGNAHPFVWGVVEGFWNALFPRKASVWTVGEGGKTEIVRKVSQQIISHNGDFDAWARRKGEEPISNNGPLAEWLTKTLGRGDPSQGDSPKIAGMLELLLAQGQWGASFRLAYALDVADSIDDVMSPSNVRKIGHSVNQIFEEWLKTASVAGCRTLQDVFNNNSLGVNDLREKILNTIRLDTVGMSQYKKELLVDRAMHYFFFNDLQEAGRLFSDQADGTFGVVLASSLYPGEIVLGSFKQPLYIGVDPETEMLVYASELASVKAAGTPGKDQVTELLPYIYFMENGEVSHFKIGEGNIPNSVAFPKGFKLMGSAPFTDLSGTELAGRHPLTEENLERWASQKKEEGGRGWIGTKGNKNLSGGVLVSESSDLVLDTINDVPKVLATINEDWGGENPGSPNLGAAEDFSEALLERARVRALAQYPDDPAYKNQIDVLVLGAEYGFYAGDHFATDLKELFPGLNVKAVDSKAFAVDPERYAVGPNTIVLAISHSGQYFHTVDDVSFLNALHEQGRCGPVFGMAGLIDSVPLGQALGQSYKASAKSNRRLFVTHAGWRLDEPKPVVPLATEISLTHLLVHVADKAEQSKFGRSVNDNTILRLKKGQAYLQERAESIFGINKKGQKVDAQEHKELVAVGHRYSQRLTEFLIAMPLAAVHLFLVLFIGGNPVQGGFEVLFSLSQWAMFSDTTTLGHLIISYWQVPYFIMAYFVAAFMLRLVQRRPFWGRYVSAPTLFLGDTPFVHKTLEAYLRKLFSLSYGWASWGEFKTGDTQAEYVDEVNPSIKRGDVLFKGLPTLSGMRALAQMIATQLRGSLSINSTAEAFALGHLPPADGKFNGYTVLAQEDAEGLKKIRGSESDGGDMSLLESRVFSIERLMAFIVIFHANAARTRDMTNRFIRVLRWVAWPVLFLVRVVSLGKFQVPLFPWDIAETHGRANIFTTQVGKPISVPVEHFSPRAFHVNGKPVAPRATSADPRGNSEHSTEEPAPSSMSETDPENQSVLERDVPSESFEQESRKAKPLAPNQGINGSAEQMMSSRAEGSEGNGLRDNDGAPFGSEKRLIEKEQVTAAVPIQVSDQTGGGQEEKNGIGIVTVIGRVVRQSYKFMVVLFASIILTSSDGYRAFTSSVENGLRQTFNVALVSDVYNAPAISDSQQSDLDVPANSPRAFVNTKRTPLMSFDRNPSDKNQVIGRVAAHSLVKVVGRKGSWVLVSAASGKRGWVNSRSVREASGGRMTVVRRAPLFKTPVFRMANLPKGAQVAVLEKDGNGKWVRVAPLYNPKRSVWVSAQYLSENPPVDVSAPSKKIETMTAMQPLADRVQGLLSAMGQPIPVLGGMAGRVMKEGKLHYRPGDVLHRRLLAGAINEFDEGSNRDAAIALTGFIDQPSSSGLDQTDQQLALALGYGAVAGEKWAQEGPPKDRALYDDYRQTRALLHRTPLSARAGRALTRLARQASRWRTSSAPSFAPGALPVINLSEANFDSSLLGDWAEALGRVARGEPAPVVVVLNPAQQTKWESALKEWKQAHPEMASTLTEQVVNFSRWVHLDNLGSDVVDRNEDGIAQVVRVGALLGSAQVDMSGFAGGVDVLTGVGTSLTWDRSDVPASIAVRMIIGVFEGLYLSAPLDEAQKKIRAVRQALAAA